MRLVISIDDTDDLASRGTGEMASLMGETIAERGWGTPSLVTRHQLFLHPEIPYTSHNSAMAFVAEVHPQSLPEIAFYASDFLQRESSNESDPGLCIVEVERLADPAALVAFGKEAKQSILTVEKAYALARNLPIRLSAHGGTGLGVIGALAGAGLRLDGNDGQMRGTLGLDVPMATVEELLAHPWVDAVRTEAGTDLPIDARVAIGEKAKTVLLGGRSVLLVGPTSPEVFGPRFRTLSRQELRRY